MWILGRQRKFTEQKKLSISVDKPNIYKQFVYICNDISVYNQSL